MNWLKKIMSQLSQSPEAAQNGSFLHKDSVLKILKTDTFDIPVVSAPASGSTTTNTVTIDTGFQSTSVPMILVYITSSNNTFSQPLPYFTYRSVTATNGYILGQLLYFVAYANTQTVNLPNSTNVQIDIICDNRDENNDLGPFIGRYYLIEQTI